MSWSLFKCYCKEASHSLEKGDDIEFAFSAAERSPLPKMLKAQLKPKSLQQSLISKLKNSDLSTDELQITLKIYGNLGFSELAHKPSRIRRVGLYLAYLTLMFSLLSSIYLLKVYPTVLDMYEEFGYPMSEGLIWFSEYWGLLVSTIIGFLAISLLINHKIKVIFDHQIGVGNSLLFKLLLPKRLKESYRGLLNLIHLPLNLTKKTNQNAENILIEYLLKKDYTPEEIADLLTLTITEQVTRLKTQAESYLRKFYILIAILIVFSIYEFVSSVYAPIFTLGEVI